MSKRKLGSGIPAGPPRSIGCQSSARQSPQSLALHGESMRAGEQFQHFLKISEETHIHKAATSPPGRGWQNAWQGWRVGCRRRDSSRGGWGNWPVPTLPCVACREAAACMEAASRPCSRSSCSSSSCSSVGSKLYIGMSWWRSFSSLGGGQRLFEGRIEPSSLSPGGQESHTPSLRYPKSPLRIH